MAMAFAVTLIDVKRGESGESRLRRGERIWTLYRRGKSVKQLMAWYKLDRATIYRWISRFEEASDKLATSARYSREDSDS